MTLRSLVALLSAAALALAGCRSPEEKLVDRRRDLRARLDRLHADFGASGPAGGDAAKAGSEGGLVGRMLAEVDRAHFEQYCLAVGRGERPFAASGRLEAFVHEPAHARSCRKAADLAIEIDALEREVGGR